MMFILEKLRFEPEKLGAWLQFTSYSRLERVHFCITLIMCPQLKSEHLLLIAQTLIENTFRNKN